jgi:hypothetical protein
VDLVLQALRSRHIEIREAAISVIEQWATPELLRALEQHQESTPWLSRYAAKVLRDLQDRLS